MFTQKFIKTFHSVQEIVKLGNTSANPKWHLTISWATSCQYQCVCKILSKYSKRFRVIHTFSRTGQWQNLHKQAGDKNQMFGHSESQPWASALVDFLSIVQFRTELSGTRCHYMKVWGVGWQLLLQSVTSMMLVYSSVVHRYCYNVCIL